MGTTEITLEMPFTNCEINLILTCSENYVVTCGGIDGQVPTFAITDIKLFVPVVTLSTYLPYRQCKIIREFKIGC